jgi:DNA sulfur modification protein DndE
MLLETVRLSQRAKDQLSRVKRDTGIKNWNVLSRWALCLSLAEPTQPAPAKIVTDSSVEMNWRTFGGVDADLYHALMIQRCVQDGLGTNPDVVAEQFKLHLHRGIGYLFGNPKLKSLEGLFDACV